MNLNLKLNKIEIDTQGVISSMMPYLKSALDKAEEKLIDLMKKAIDETSSAPKNWRNALKNDLHHVSEEILGTQINYIAGVEYAEGSGAWMRAMVIAYGMGIYGLNGNKIMAGPAGREVWDGDLENKIPSRVEQEHEIPRSWYHAGGWFIQNAMSNMKAIYADIIESELRNVPVDVFRKNIKVTAR